LPSASRNKQFSHIRKQKPRISIRGFFVAAHPPYAGCKIRKTAADFEYCRRITANISSEATSMIKVSVMYPNTQGGRFDHDYYRDKHMPLVKARMGDACKFYTVDKGLAGGAPGAPATYVGMCHIYCDSVEAFQSGFGPHAKEIMGDIPNYTDQSPVIQISEVVVGQ
jgi:uncharacterized protein (TIGR02118 family)